MSVVYTVGVDPHYPALIVDSDAYSEMFLRDEIVAETTESGTLVSVSLASHPDGAETTFSILLPLLATEHGTITELEAVGCFGRAGGPIPLLPWQTSLCVRLRGVAEPVTLPGAASLSMHPPQPALVAS